MAMQLLLPLTAISLLLPLVLWLLLRRRIAREKARDDFTRFIATINDWAANRTNYQLIALALSALELHNNRLSLAAAKSRAPWLEKREKYNYLVEYRLCQARHSVLLSDAIEDNAAVSMAKELEQAIEELSDIVTLTDRG